MDTQTVLVPCPVALVEELVRVRDRLMRGEPEQSPLSELSPSEEVVVVAKQGPWTRERTITLARETKYDEIRHLMGLLGEAGGDWVDDPPRLHMDQVYLRRNQLSAWSKLTKRLFGEMIWPIEWRRNPDGTYGYRAHPRVITWWTEGLESSQLSPREGG